MKFAIKLVLLLGIMLLAISAFFSYYVYVESRNALQEEITNRMEEHASSTMNKIDMMLFERYSNLQVLTNQPLMRARNTPPEVRNNILLSFRNFHKSYASLSFFDLDRVRIADTAGLQIGQQHQIIGYWEDVLQGKISTASDIRVAEEFNIPLIYFAAPVKDEKEETYGAAVARVPLSKVYDILSFGESEVKASPN